MDLFTPRESRVRATVHNIYQGLRLFSTHIIDISQSLFLERYRDESSLVSVSLFPTDDSIIVLYYGMQYVLL